MTSMGAPTHSLGDISATVPGLKEHRCVFTRAGSVMDMQIALMQLMNKIATMQEG